MNFFLSKFPDNISLRSKQEYNVVQLIWNKKGRFPNNDDNTFNFSNRFEHFKWDVKISALLGKLRISQKKKK